MLSIYRGVSQIYTPHRPFHLRYPCISVHPPSLLNYMLGNRDWASLEMHFEAVLEWTDRFTLRPSSSVCGYALGGRDRVNSGGRDRASLEMHLEAVIDRVWRCTGKPWSSEFRNALGGRDAVHWEMHLEALIERVWTCTWRPRQSEHRDALWGYDRASLEMHLQAMIEPDSRSTWRRSTWREAWRQLRLYSLVNL